MKRKAIALLVATMMALSLVPMMAMPAFAATVSGVSSPPNLLINATNQAIGNVVITESYAGELAVGTTVTVTLPSGVDFVATAPQNVAIVAGAGNGYAAATDVTTALVASGADQVVATVIAASTGLGGTIVIPGGTGAFSVDLDNTVAPGDVLATITSSSGQVSGTVKIGTAVNASTNSTCITSPLPNVLAGVNNQAIGQLRIEENVAGVLSNGQTITVTTPSGTSFNAAPVVTVTTVNGLAGALTLVSNMATLTNANRVATWTVGAASTNRSRMTITTAARLNVGAQVPPGEIKVTVGGSDPDIQAQDVSIAKVISLGTENTCTTSPIPNLTIGGGAQAVGNIRIEENAAGSLIGSGRYITLTAPDNVVFTAAPTVAVATGDLVLGATSLSVDGKVVTITIAIASTVRSRINITMPTMTPNADALPGDLNIAIGGTAGATAGTVKVGLLRLPGSIAAASKPSIKLGDQGASVGNLTVTENFAGAFAGNIDIRLPSGVEWYSVLPTVTVSGNMVIGTPTRIPGYYANDTFRIPVIVASVGSPSTLTITGIKYNAQAGAVLGSVYAKLQNSNQMKVANANLVSGVTQATFVIGQNTYTAGGVTYVMDAKAYTKDGRAFVPVRYLAYAMGISGSGIAWDAATKTVTLTKGSTVVKLVIGSKNLDKNGAVTTMDVAPETVGGRTMLPARYVAEAFGGNVDWNSANQTVYITYL
ncbi:MAG: copper amine oxidase N-terminal domain-containing protein [Actinomycetota bacterium]|nr:copper amine oxidase N-terminal domain-containing protein [Actinomycetota bacterium]